MHPWAFLVHLGNFVWPAVALATLLVPGVVGWRGLALRGSAARRLWRAWARRLISAGSGCDASIEVTAPSEK